MDENFIAEFNSKLSSCDKFTSRAALIDLRKKVEASAFTRDQLCHLSQLIVDFFTSENGNSFRETTSQLLFIIVSHTDLNEETFSKFLLLVLQRIVAESSEEVRLFLMKACHAAIRNKECQGDYIKSLDTITSIVKLALRDKYGEIIKETCDCITTLSKTTDHFHLQADFFVEPLLHNFKNLPMKVRVSCVKAFCPVLIHAPLTIPNILPVMERAWHESSPQLKLAIIQTIGRVALSIEIADQSYHYLLPVLLLGLGHDYKEVSSEAEDVWTVLGRKEGYDQVLKDSLKKHISKLLADCEDWNNDVRCQTAQLVYQFILELPDRQTELSTLMEILVFQVGDELANVRQWALKSARLLGESVPKKAFRWLMKRENPSPGDVAIFAQLVIGFLEKGNIRPKVVGLCRDLLVKFSTVKESMLFDCIKAFLEKNIEIEGDGLDQLLTVVLSLEGSEEVTSTTNRQELLEKLACKLEYKDATTMIRSKMPIIWKYEDAEKWDMTSSPWRILSFIASDLKAIDGFTFGLLRRVIETTPSAEMKLKSFNMLTAAMNDLECESPDLQSLLLANLKWKAGRSASVLRSSVALCAVTALECKKIQLNKENAEAWANVLQYIIEDELTNTRLMALKILKHCLISSQLANKDKFISAMMGRLNDSSREVRQESIAGLGDVFLHWRSQGAALSEEENFIGLLRILSKDEDKITQCSAEGMLKSFVDPSGTIELSKMNLNELKENGISCEAD